jgi:hypothetical protein
MGLNLGQIIPEWPPENLEQLAKQIDDQFN